MSIIDRIILTLYTCSLGVAAVLIMIVSLNLVPLDEFVAFASRIPGRWEYTVGGAVLFMMSLRLLVAGWSRGSSSSLTIDTEQCPVMDYFEIFMGRMLLCRKAAEKLGLQFKLMINEQQLI